MDKTPGMAVIGMGVVGRRMIEQVGLHGGWRITSAFDIDPLVRSSLQKEHPQLVVTDSAQEAIEKDGVDLVYVAVPPLFHHDLVLQAVASRRAILCEKPLGIDIDQSRLLAHVVNQSGLPQAVNFVFSSADAVDHLGRALQDPAFGLRSIEIRLHFKDWPRDWQRGAQWLTRSEQGGFVREVMSHFVFLLMRLRSPLQLLAARVYGPDRDAAEVSALALLDAAGTPVSLHGLVGGPGPDLIHAQFHGACETLLLSDWYHLTRRSGPFPLGRSMPGLPAEPRLATYQRQLDQLLALIQGRPHNLASFDEALSVQMLIENILKQAYSTHS